MNARRNQIRLPCLRAKAPLILWRKPYRPLTWTWPTKRSFWWAGRRACRKPKLRRRRPAKARSRRKLPWPTGRFLPQLLSPCRWTKMTTTRCFQFACSTPSQKTKVLIIHALDSAKLISLSIFVCFSGINAQLLDAVLIPAKNKASKRSTFVFEGTVFDFSKNIGVALSLNSSYYHLQLSRTSTRLRIIVCCIYLV